MIESAWMTGVLMALSAFGVKVGLGSSAVLYNPAVSVPRKACFAVGAGIAYSLVFAGACWIVQSSLIIRNLGEYISIMRYGMLVHLVLAAGLLVWGSWLLTRCNDTARGGNGSEAGLLLLILPCPVCATVILVTVSFAHSLSGFSLRTIGAILFGTFILMAALTALAVLPFRRRIARARSRFLGTVMIGVALYFLLIVIVAPVYQEAGDVYLLTSQSPDAASVNTPHLWLSAAGMSGLFLAGFWHRWRRDKLTGPTT